VHISTATVTTGSESLDDPDAFEHVEVMGQQVRPEVEQMAQLNG